MHKEKLRVLLNYHIDSFLHWDPMSLSKVFGQIIPLFCKTPLQDLILRSLLLKQHINSATQTSSSRNKCVYQLKEIARNKMYDFDISTRKLWCAIFLYMAGDYQSSLDIINQVLSCIQPFAFQRHACDETLELYKDMFRDTDMTIIQKAKMAWMFPMNFSKDSSYPLPLAIKIELYFSRSYIMVSPFTCAYYLQFLCYFDRHQSNNRDSALEQLVDFAKNAAKDPSAFYDLNIAGHCLLLAGKIVEARDMFYLSNTLTQNISPLINEENSARWYLLRFF